MSVHDLGLPALLRALQIEVLDHANASKQRGGPAYSKSHFHVMFTFAVPMPLQLKVKFSMLMQQAIEVRWRLLALKMFIWWWGKK